MKFPKICLLGSSLTILAACGSGAKAPSRDVTVTAIPAFPSINDNVFALQNGKTSVSYKSTMLIMNPYSKPEYLADIIGKSELTRIKAAEAKAFVGDEKEFDKNYGDSGVVSSQIKAKQEEIRVFMSEAEKRSEPLPINERHRLIADWMATDGTQLGLTPEMNVELQGHIATYCDAKILELAAHPGFAKLSPTGFASRPSPHQFCESYYASKGYFQGPSCEAEGNVFQCLWTEGVLKSGSFNTPAGATLLTDLTALFADADKTEIFRKIISGDETLAAPYVKVTSPLYKDSLYKKKTYFYVGLLSGKPALGQETACKAMLEPSYQFICGALGQSWKAKSAEATLTDIELNSGLLLDRTNQSLNFLSLALRYYGVRSRSGGVQFSNSDYYFFDLTPATVLNQPISSATGLSQIEITQVNNTFSSKIFKMLPEDLEKQKALEQSFSELVKDYNYHRAERDRLTEVAGEALIQGIRSANAGDVALGFIAYRVEVDHTTELMRLRLTFEGFKDQVFEGCYDKQKLVPTDCGASSISLGSTVTVHPSRLSLNPSKGRIELTLTLDHPEEVGLGPIAKKEASPDYFMLIPEDKIQGTQLYFELYPNRLLNSLDILTGKALFQRDGATLYEAGLSMWEE